MTIKNEVTIKEENIVNHRGAIEHRAMWLYLLYDEAKKEGIDLEPIARRAITRCGEFQGKDLYEECPLPEIPSEFAKTFAEYPFGELFEMEVLDVNDKGFDIHFHHCPLVAGWQQIGADEKTIAKLCDMAMDGDREMAKQCKYKFTLGKTIAEGNDYCELMFRK